MWIDKLTSSATTHALELAARFAEARHSVLAENLANIDTPDYAARRLDVGSFQDALDSALHSAKDERRRTLNLRDNRQFRSTADGGVEVRPDVEPAQNVLLHDGTNVRVEQLMSDINANALSYEAASTLLRGRYEGLLRAIRGRVT